MARFSKLAEIRQLDPERDHQRICYLSSCFEFPFDITRSLEFALFRTFCSSTISAILASTREFNDRPQRRYDDTDLIVSALIESGYESDTGRAALKRLNQLHGRYVIDNADFLYVLSTFVFEPIRWTDRFGWRPMCEQERLAFFYFWREVGKRMNIRAIPDTCAAFEAYNVDYERRNFHYAPTNRMVGQATRDMFLGWFLPPALYKVGAPAIYAMMDEPLLEAFGFPRPPALLRTIVQGALKARAHVLRLLPERKNPRLRTRLPHRTYPNGYRIEELGPREPTASPYLRARYHAVSEGDSIHDAAH